MICSTAPHFTLRFAEIPPPGPETVRRLPANSESLAEAEEGMEVP